MAKYRKKPVVIEAFLYEKGKGLEDGYKMFKGVLTPYIDTLEGPLFISQGDYVITGVSGERYSCKPDIFLKTYDKVED